MALPACALFDTRSVPMDAAFAPTAREVLLEEDDPHVVDGTMLVLLHGGDRSESWAYGVWEVVPFHPVGGGACASLWEWTNDGTGAGGGGGSEDCFPAEDLDDEFIRHQLIEVQGTWLLTVAALPRVVDVIVEVAGRDEPLRLRRGPAGRQLRHHAIVFGPGERPVITTLVARDRQGAELLRMEGTDLG